jgi:hypothetical protein
MESAMTLHCPRTFTAAALTATGLLLTACNSSPAAPSTQAAQPVPHAITQTPVAAAAPVTPSETAAPLTTPSSTPQASVTDACALITEADATTALGADPGPGEAAPGHCIYAAGPASMNITVRSIPDGAASFAQLRTATGSHAVDVPNIGDAAFGTFEGSIAVINFYKGSTLVAVELANGAATASSKNQTTALAKIAAGRV